MSKSLVSDYFSCISDTLPYLKSYFGKVFVIKYGGSVMSNPSVKLQFIRDLCFLYFCGINIILVHGGGPSISKWLSRLNIQTKFKSGVRVTDTQTMEIVEMVLVGKINKELVLSFNLEGVPSIGLSGKDAGLITARPSSNEEDNLVGLVDNVDIRLLNLLLANKYVPVISPIASGNNNKTYNINADTVAGAISSSLKADKLILLTDAPGVMRNLGDSSTLIKELDINYANQLKKDSIISGGMIPKVDCCISALECGVKSTHIIDGNKKHALLHEILTDDRMGSMITL
uniref:Acetylglutamate kinase n=1 Tax=Platysiphonia delicata TaxID=2006979 RepID=A0A1Z1M1L3_9FLOR|nr:acetylglutamate kinase [Platysiphonia delicata]ARW59663.1 acetylglutamate kinase [Platysiphonia delicata]